MKKSKNPTVARNWLQDSQLKLTTRQHPALLIHTGAAHVVQLQHPAAQYVPSELC